MSERSESIFVVVWDCFTPKALAAFTDRADAERYAAEFKVSIDAFMKRIALRGDERVYVDIALLNPKFIDEKKP